MNTEIKLTNKFWDKVNKTSTYWLWTGAKNPQGYGQTRINYKLFLAHRITYMTIIGEIPKNLELDHLCRVRNCINPEHLEPVTHKENMLRGARPGPAKKATCFKGHQLRYKFGRQICDTCRNETQMRKYYRDKEAKKLLDDYRLTYKQKCASMEVV